MNKSENLKCYECIAVEDIDSPDCLHPATRKAPEQDCMGTPAQTNSTADGRRCIKVVYYSTGVLRGQVLKTWIMLRYCLAPEFSEQLFGTKLECDECKMLPGKLKIHQRHQLMEAGTLPRSYHAEEQVQEYRQVCTCCTDLCNAEDGFNISYFENDETSPSEKLCLSSCLLIWCALLVNSRSRCYSV